MVKELERKIEISKLKQAGISTTFRDTLSVISNCDLVSMLTDQFIVVSSMINKQKGLYKMWH